MLLWSSLISHDFSSFFKKILFIYLFLERGKGGSKEGGREGEKHQCVVASHVPPTGDLACNPARALIGNQIGDPLVHRLALSLVNHTSQG